MRRVWIKYLSTSARYAIWALVLILAGLLINLIAIGLLGDTSAWSTWLQDHSTGLLVWRLYLYAAILYGWRWMRTRLLQREPDAAARLRRAECAGIAALMLLEVSNALTGSGAS
ncbi:hypothetical protein cym2001_16610 [Pseudomonas sp. CYM-20-01]|uniref:hypothetical protein n=1 Tax=Pseudomonas sp. CYM-20-01 TaxID=2870750 RepID=UPI002049814A|nr:hypothetical protein [Pseudomonas sp. CYM-20-01]BDB18296.1 hypothetical protein cym2001_16610 [Pseudomonas sp. CYM-20-01]